MTTYADRYQAALLAHAAYYRFDGAQPGEGAITGIPLLATLVSPDESGTNRFTQAQAVELEDRYQVIGYREVPETGFQAVVFEEIATGRRILSIRGTEEFLDLAADVALVFLK